MTSEEYQKITDELLHLARQIEDSKRPSYTVGSEDVLANFKRVGTASGMTPAQCCLVYMMKHVDAICTLISKPELDDPEPAITRFCDLINYTRLLFALTQEGEGLNQ